MFVSGTVYERLSRALDDARDEIRVQLEYNRALVQIIVDMRRDGFVSPPKGAPAPTPEQRSRMGIEETIRLVSPDKQAATMTRAWVASQRAAGTPDEEIQHALLQPLPDEGEGVPV